jgi:putative ABC transport system substrate-binding protein
MVLALLLLTAPLAAQAQQAGKVAKIGVLGGGKSAGFYDAFKEGLRELGYHDGRNIIIEYRWYEGRADRARDLARELVSLAPDLLVAVGPYGAVAAKEATASIPTVFALAADPVRTGLVASLSHPGGNRTGLAYDATPELAGKTVQLLRELVPRVHRVAILWNPASPDIEPFLREARRSAKTLGLSTVDAPIQQVGDFEAAFASMRQGRAEALVVIPDPVTVVHQRRLTELAAKHKLPAIYQFRQSVEAGGLLSYGPSAIALLRRAAYYVDKILKGAKPADIPVEQPTQFELVINLKTAKVLGLTIPPPLLLRADQVIE